MAHMAAKLEGDIHQVNADVAGITGTRPRPRSMPPANAGNQRLGEILGKGAKEQAAA